MRHYILGTAGHVDHGKTELVKALTGRDTDRLKEEKERGISIELGFAPLALGEDTFIGIIDAPGHERFVKKMVAGSVGIDMALLLVAADEGVMPQTKEHLEVLSSLSIPVGIVVISKCDLASEDMKLILKDEIEELVEGTFLESAPIVETSARTGEGIESLKRELKTLTADFESRDTNGPFRLPVDRIFHRKGIGVVITGSCYSGMVKVGDTLELLPSGKKVRVRELQSFNTKIEKGVAGERLAIALQGIKLNEMSRGDMLVSPAQFRPSEMIDAHIRLGTYANFELKNRERIRFHHGAKEVLGRAVLLDRNVLRSGESAFAQFRLESSIVPGDGDSFVIRKYSPVRVMGGGKVLAPHAVRHKRHDPSVLEDLQLLMRGAPEETLLKAIRIAELKGAREKDLDASALRPLVEKGDVIVIEGIAFHRNALDALAEKVSALARSYCEAYPLRYGIDKEELRQKTRFPHPMLVFNRALEELGKYQPVYVKRNRVRSQSEIFSLPEKLQREMERLEQILRSAGLLFLTRKEIEEKWTGESPLVDAIQYLRDEGRVVAVGADGFIHREALLTCLSKLETLFEKHHQISVADFKKACDLTRKHAIPLLELMDAEKVTLRVANMREKGPGFSSWRFRNCGDPGRAGPRKL
ncbi:MAG: selenocysteine-specific translation elongation factor [Candidatus Latescibacteria bacterium]|nr:selenocysteine-specific translation elongation factor [Candidatus Latescibacterota bacterium]NIM22582.1 selenocysteine-specific translation elongation factor [Candidatus Latescibacterota bacterium]NIM64871.1 selenocysteine-specific translation elongation factor [Candidatus Latescibacterota bacterium]NIO01386.1 selenocysteine-specific translation elongation factor [Candidatus Latescibacterota bacterium]NIO27896.1 selenocysteine-specific translation elongation factor [Candidatus Latescibactero